MNTKRATLAGLAGLAAAALIGVAHPAPAHADIDSCIASGACNYDGSDRGGCYGGAPNFGWYADLPCIDRYGNWRGLPPGAPIPFIPAGPVFLPHPVPMGPAFMPHPPMGPMMPHPGMPMGPGGMPHLAMMPPMGHACMPYAGCR
jgi:hypothetical protein